MGILIRQGGILTSVQDGGRFGAQLSGISVTGAADLLAYETASYLVGNFFGEACLEATMAGLEIEFTSPNTVAVTGGDMTPLLNDQATPMYTTLAAETGDVLRLSAYRSGFRTYIAFAGGLDVPLVYGSRSTHLRCGFGGFSGRKLASGDRLEFAAPAPGRRIGESVPPADYSGDPIVLRAVLGPQDDYFTEEGIETFFSAVYTTTSEMDRLGARLEGPVIQHAREAGIISDGVAFGSVQVPASGKPIVMLADRQSTGGYAKIATIASVDIPLLAQATPGRKVQFRQVSVEQAQALYLERRRDMAALAERMRLPSLPVNPSRLDVPVLLETPDEWMEYFVTTEKASYRVRVRKLSG